MIKKVTFAGIAIVAIILIILGIWFFTMPRTTVPATLEPISVGNLLYEYSGLIFIADDQGFFTGNGLNVTLASYTSSVASIKGVENNNTDIALAPEYSIVTEAFNGENITGIGNIDKYQSVFLMCRNDHGISSGSDLKGKSIGLTRGTIGEFYLGRFLSLHGIQMKDVTLVNMPTTQYVEAIANGSVDAVVTVYKYLDQGIEKLGDRLVALPIQSSQKGYVVLVCRNDWAAGHPGMIDKFLKSMKQAEEYTIAHPAEAKAIVKRYMNYSDATMEAIWPDHHYALTLDQSLITAMEDEGRWMIANNLTNATAIPDFRNYIYSEGLKNVKPDAVNII